MNPEIALGLEDVDVFDKNKEYLRQTIIGESVVMYVFTYFNINYKDSKSRYKDKAYKKQRQIAAHIISEECNLLTQWSIAAMITLDRSTAVYHINTMRERMSVDKLFKVEVDNVHNYVKHHLNNVAR